MSTILQNNVAPLWVWIVVIAIGSVFILLILAFIIHRCISRRKTKSKVDIEANGVATKRLTLRDGKVVEDQYTSPSTGSVSQLLSNEPVSAGSQIPTSKGSWFKEKTFIGSPSTTDSQDNTPVTVTYSKAPRLSLGSFDDKEPLSSFGSVSDLSVVSKPSTAAVNEPPKARVVNFSRPQSRNQQHPTAAKKTRLSVINESTPRNSFINRIVSWASNNYDSESKKSDSLDTKQSSSSASRDFAETKEDSITASSPLIDALQELQRLGEAPTPELPSKHPSRQTSNSDMTLPVGSRASSVNETRYKHGHKRSDSGTIFSRKGPYSTHSRSSSTTNFSRPQQITSVHSRESSNTSMFEEPQATLSGPFDALAAMGRRGSVASTWSSETDRVNVQQPQPRNTATSSISPDNDSSTINTDLLLSERTSITPSTSSHIDGRQSRNRSRSRSRSRGPTRTVNKSGQTVLRKRSLQIPEITMLGPVDPSALENLSVAGQ